MHSTLPWAACSATQSPALCAPRIADRWQEAAEREWRKKQRAEAQRAAAQLAALTVARAEQAGRKQAAAAEAAAAEKLEAARVAEEVRRAQAAVAATVRALSSRALQTPKSGICILPPIAAGAADACNCPMHKGAIAWQPGNELCCTCVRISLPTITQAQPLKDGTCAGRRPGGDEAAARGTTGGANRRSRRGRQKGGGGAQAGGRCRQGQVCRACGMRGGKHG